MRIFLFSTPPVFLSQNMLGSAKFVTPKTPKYDVAVFGWDTKESDLPYLTGVKSNKITLVGAKVSASPEIKMDLQALLKDKFGNTLKQLKCSVDGNVQTFSCDFTGIDMSKVDRIVFKAFGSGNWAAIRRIIVDGEVLPSVTQKCDGVAPLNHQLEKLIDQLKTEKISNDSLMNLLQLLKLYQALER